MIWTAIWDDCPPMGNHTQYREIVHKLIVEGLPAHEVTYTDAQGKIKRLASGPVRRAQTTTSALEQANEMREQLARAREAARLASAPNE